MEEHMKIKQMTERLNSVPVRKKAKRILAITLAVLMVNPVTGYGVTAHAQETHTITAFSELSGKIASQQLAVGAEESDINLPDTLNVTVGVSSADTAESIVKDSQAEEIPTEEVKPDESNLEEPAADESPADDSSVSGNDAEEPQEDENGAENNTATDSQATVVLDSGEVPLAATTTGSAISVELDDADTEQTETETITTEDRTLTGITWQINAERSGSDTFNSENAGAVFYYEPVLPEGYILADGVSLPQIQVEIEESARWVFSQSTTIDGVEITVKAEKDVFPEGAVLHAEKVTSAEDKEKIQSAVSKELQSVDTTRTITELVSFDITITDADGNELQPDTSKGEVKVSFAQLPMVKEDAAPAQELKVFHMDDSLNEAEGLDTTVDQEEGTLEVSAEHFSVFSAMLLTGTEVTKLEGAGTVDSPYQITSANDLVFMASKVNANAYGNTVYFRLETDIDLSGISDWTPIGNSNDTPFKSKFDGNGKTISNLKVTNTDISDVGLFGVIDQWGEVKKLGLRDVQIKAGFSKNNIGGIAGLVKGTISECYVTGSIDANFTTAGGVAGSVKFGTLSNCYAAVDLQGGFMSQGGVAGEVSGGSVKNCYSTGSVQGYQQIGGVVGTISTYGSSTVTNCFATGAINATSKAGGAAGSITETYNVKDLAALNISVSGSENIGRVAGFISQGNVQGEVAFEGMLITPQGSSRKDGASISTSAIQADNYFSTLFSNDSAWVFETKKLPVLKNVGGEQSSTLPAHLISLAPSAPQNLKTTVGNQEITLQWAIPTSNADGIIGYEVSNDNGGSWISAGSNLTYTFTGMENGLNYTLAVRAVTGDEKGAKATIEAIPGRKPGGPKALAITTFRDDDDKKRITLTWAAPDFQGDSTITEYMVCIGSMGVFVSAGNDISYTFTEKDPNFHVISWGQQQAFQVYARNLSGDGEAVSGVFDIAAVSTKPQNFTATPDENGNVLLNWTAPSDMGGASVTSYRVSKDGGSSWTAVSSGLTHTFSDLANGTSYDFAVQAYNSKGWSNSATKTATAVRTVRFTDSNTSLTVVRKSNKACTFTASGSGAITYSLEGTIPAGVAINAATGELTVDGSIAPAGTYSFSVKGTDNVGISATKTFKLTVKKITVSDSDIVWPSAAGITYGQPLSDSKLTGGSETGTWAWKNGNIVPTAGNNSYDVMFTPNDIDNYDWSGLDLTQKVNLAVNRATPEVLILPTAASITYGQLISDSGLTGGSKTGTWAWKDGSIIPSVANSGYDVVFTPNDIDNYDWSGVDLTQKVNLAVNRATLEALTWPTAASITYGQKLSASALSVSSTEYGTFAWTDGSTVPTVTNGGYEVTFTPNAGTVANYEAITNTTKMVAITVSKATPAVTVSADISDDGGSRKATLTATVTGTGDGETPTGTIKFVNSTSGSDVDIEGATAVTITGGKATYTWTGLAKQIYKVKAVYNDSANYNTATSTELSFDTNKQNQAALNIGSIGTKTYGDGTFTLSATGGSGGGAVTFESSDPSIVSISGTTATIHKAGTVTITATKAANNTYNEVTASVSLTVGKKTLSVKANDQLNIIKGAAMPELTYTATGLVGSDTFTSSSISTTATDTNTVGEYDITISGGTLANADSYAVTYTNGKLTVVNATYTVTVTNGTGGSSYSEGQTVTITADSRGGYTFTGWSSSDGVTFANSTASTTTFTMPGKAVTVTANYSKNSSGDSGGSSSGGSSSGGSSTSTTTTTPEKKPNQPVTVAAPVTATAESNGAASASIPDKAVTDAIAKAQSDATSQGKTANGISVELDVTMPKGTASLTATLTRNSLDSLVSAGVSSLEINGSLVQVSFDKKALTEIQKQSSGNISIAIAPKTNLSDVAKKLIGTRPVYDITVGYGSGKSVSSFGGGIATVSIPYTLGKNEAVGGLYAVYVDAKGNATRIAGSAYDTNSGCVIFTTTHFSQYGIGYTAPTAKFTDISTHWAKESVGYVVGRGLLSGTSDTAFSPNSAMTRGMLVTALGRLAGVDTKAYTGNSFTDVNADSAYRPYIEWACSKGIIQGIGGNQFAPDRAITREEIAVIFTNYAKATGYTLPITREATTYADVSSIGSAYKDAVKAMQQAGIMMGGSDNKFNPKGNATRAEVSSMLNRYIKLTINPDTAQGWTLNDAGQYLYYKDGKSLTGTQTIDGVKYFFNTDGTLKTGWVKDGDNWRYYSGKTMLVGFWDLGANGNNKTYYFTTDGLMVSGKWLEIDGKWYYFYTDGSLARSTKIDGYEVDEKGVRKAK
jgi:uncharacterized repeat protein (TIGR02543 family)